MEYKLDMDMIFTMHDALRRELGELGRIASRQDDNPATLLRTALGWELFKKFLTIHHRSEDDALWPPLRAATAGHPDQLALADASLTPQQWQHFAQVHGERNLPDAPTYLPWLLTGATPQTLDAVLGKLPPPLLAAYRQQWAPAYAAVAIWPANSEPEKVSTQAIGSASTVVARSAAD